MRLYLKSRWSYRRQEIRRGRFLKSCRSKWMIEKYTFKKSNNRKKKKNSTHWNKFRKVRLDSKLKKINWSKRNSATKKHWTIRSRNRAKWRWCTWWTTRRWLWTKQICKPTSAVTTTPPPKYLAPLASQVNLKNKRIVKCLTMEIAKTLWAETFWKNKRDFNSTATPKMCYRKILNTCSMNTNQWVPQLIESNQGTRALEIFSIDRNLN